MPLHDGREYLDDRLFILDLSPAIKGQRHVWAVTTRRNCRGFPPFRVDDFPTEEEAIEFIKEIESQTPRISLGGRSPQAPLSYEDYCEQLRREGVPSALEFRELNRRTQREIVIEEVSPKELEK